MMWTYLHEPFVTCLIVTRQASALLKVQEGSIETSLEMGYDTTLILAVSP